MSRLDSISWHDIIIIPTNLVGISLTPNPSSSLDGEVEKYDFFNKVHLWP
jgi:hypothetical protein